MHSDFPQLASLGTYLDSYTAGLQPKVSLDVQIDVLRGGQGAMFRAGHRLDVRTQDFFWDSLEALGDLLHHDHRKIVPITGAEHAVNTFVQALCKSRAYGWVMDTNSVLSAMMVRRERSFELIKSSADTLCEELSERFDGGLLTISHRSLVTGEEPPLKEIQKIVEEKDGYLIVDMTGSYRPAGLVGDVTILDGSTTMLGPVGSGVALLSDRVLEEVQLETIGSYGVMELTAEGVQRSRSVERFMLYPVAVDRLVALKESMRFVLADGRLAEHVKSLASHLVEVLRGEQKVRVYTVTDSPFVTFSVDGWSSQELAVILSEAYDIHLRGGLLCSHMAVDMVGARDVMQASFHMYNTEEDIDRLGTALQELTS